MSNAHRPTWNPKQGQDSKMGTAQVSKHGMASHTKLKFRQVGQTSVSDVARRDLRAELAAAERAATDKKRKAQGLPPLPPPREEVRGAIGNGEPDGGGADEDEAAAKRRKILEEAAELDRDDSSDEDDDEDEDDDDDDDDDDTAALMAELAKIKRERAEEKARLAAEADAANAADRDAEIAGGNPLMNLQAALGQTSPGGASSATGAGGFAVKRRWDDDLIFKNQAVTLEKPKKGEFVNDLLRSEFHKKFMQKYIK